MVRLLHELILEQVNRRSDAAAIVHRQTVLDYAGLAQGIQAVAHGLLMFGLKRAERIAVYLPKRLETVLALFGTASAGGVFVPINPLLKPEQVTYILRDCNVRILVTARDRADLLNPYFAECSDLHTLVLVDEATPPPNRYPVRAIGWQTLLTASDSRQPPRV
ncbi:MAG: AMP-binding protein, partial [Candidatus Competibacter sp.]|nr:AMP-binding protein [Candidatus Competibacter sp.]